ncbi:MAG: DUF3644 domain-containing protein [Dehalococcoidales bacterium]|nr:DUF3644 domain-containing protein [Dehalococcoidales bacterium]
MVKRRRTIYSRKLELIRSSSEAALAAIQIYNNPLITFKTENFIVLMIIAWTYLLHAYYRANRIEYRYYKMGKKRRIFERLDRQYKYWELSRCLKEEACPLDRDTKNNLQFLVGLRNQVEHSRAAELDTYLSGRYQACALNYNHYLKMFFGNKYAIDKYLIYSIQFAEISSQQAKVFAESEARIPPSIRSYITQFDEALTDEEINSDRYSYRVLFVKKLTGKRGQADRVSEFIDPESDLAKNISKEYWVQKEVEKPKYIPSQIINIAREAGFTSFGMHQHTQLWKNEDAKNPAKGYGVMVANKQWYWHQRWVDFALERLRATAPETRTGL